MRWQFLAWRRELSPHDVAEKSTKISGRVLDQIDWSLVRTMHCFLPLVGDNEPDMRIVITEALAHGARVYTTQPPNRNVVALENAQLQEQLHEYKMFDSTKFDVVIVPMLAYDPKTKHRLGFGGGFYDKLLAKQPQALVLGVCFAGFETDLPNEPHDIVLGTILTA